MKKVYYLKTCNTCTRIIASLNLEGFEFQDLKAEPITAQQLDALSKLSRSYEALFSKRAKLYKEMGLKNQTLTERDYRHYLLEHYTFLSRPVIVKDNAIYIGSSKKTIERLKAELS
jgi:arsenate reductase (glutaredoxin)